MIIKVKNHKANFLIVQKTVLELTTLSFKAKGLWAYLMGLPSDWEVSVKHLIKTFPEKETAIHNMLRELINHGIVERVQTKDKNGQWNKVQYEVYETPLKNKVPQSGFPQAGNPQAENPPPTKEESNKEIKTTTKEPPDGGVVVSFSDLKIRESVKNDIKSHYTTQEIETAVKRCKRWKSRQNDESGLLTALQKADIWQDWLTNEEKEAQNKEWLKKISHLDGKIVNGYTIAVGPTYFELFAGTANKYYDISCPDFINKVTEKIISLGLEI